jgi:large subunit ribosomal protein L9
MKVILLKDVPKIGQMNDVKEVKDGFALNFLIPKGLAKMSTVAEEKKLEKQKVATDEMNKKREGELIKNLNKLKNIKIKARANEKGHLFAGIGKEEISQTLNIPIENVILPEPIKEVGEKEVEISIGDKRKKVKIEIIGDK